MFPRVARALTLVPKSGLGTTSARTNTFSKSLPSSLAAATVQRRHHHHQVARKRITEADIVKPIEIYKQTKIENASTSADKEVLIIDFVGEPSLNFPSVWLRDNCHCHECFDHKANSRLIDQQEFNPNTIPTSVKVEADQIKIIWDDGHCSEYDKQWLCDHSFEQQHQVDREDLFHEKRILWDSKTFPKIYQTFPYEQVMNEDEALLNWLVALARFGVSMVTDAPVNDNTIRLVAERVSFIKKTLYQDVFQVKSKEGATNTAYKKGQLQLHSDMPFYHHLPGTIFLHCIVQSQQGGDNLLTDGISVAQQLNNTYYRALADTVINWSDIGSDGQFEFHSLNREPCICEDKLGNIRKINWSQPQRDSRFDVTIPEATLWYKAMTEYSRLLHHPSNAITLKMQPGDILTFDNRRVLHSRANYSDGARQLNGAYLDWDEIYPKIRVLRKKLNKHR